MGEVGRLRVDLREARRADAERIAVADQRRQLGRVAQPARMRPPFGLASRRVAAQRQHVVDAGLRRSRRGCRAARRAWHRRSVRCAIASIPRSCLIHLVSSTVRARVDPPAPYVTETKSGSSGDRASSAQRRLRSPSSVLGGKNSKEKTGSTAEARISSMRIAGHCTNLDKIVSRLSATPSNTRKTSLGSWPAPRSVRSSLYASVDRTHLAMVLGVCAVFPLDHAARQRSTPFSLTFATSPCRSRCCR